MSSQLLPLLRNEFAKALRRKLPYFGLFAVALVCAIVWMVGGHLDNSATVNGWGYVALSMQLVFTDIGPVFIVVFSAMSLSEETGNGTIRAALAAPVHRWELYLAKAAIGICYMLALSLLAFVLSVAFAKIHYSFGAVGDNFGVVYPRGVAMREFITGFALSWIPLVALVAYGLLVSTIVRTPGAAVAVGISALAIIDFTKHLLGLDPYIFTRYIIYPWSTLQQLSQGMDYQWQTDVGKMILLSAVSAVVTFGIGLTIFVREDLNH